MIILRNVCKSFLGRTVLDALSFSLKAGESLALLGLSGSGKTTALKLICGLQTLDSGDISIAGMPVSPQSLTTIRGYIGYVIQDGGLFPHLTARENISLVGEEARYSHAQIEQRISDLAKLAKIDEHLLDQYPRELSGGQRQRIGIMRALFLDPKILLLDEPLGALDPITRHELQLELKELIKRLGKTVVLVTHDLHEATFLADRIILLSDGKVVQDGTMAELIKSPATDFVKAFVRAQKHQEELA